MMSICSSVRLSSQINWKFVKFFESNQRVSILRCFPHAQIFTNNVFNAKKLSRIDVTDISALNQPSKSSLNDSKSKVRPKTTAVIKVYVKDEKNRMLGMMTENEAKTLAHKRHMFLKREEDSTIKKVSTFCLVNPRQQSQIPESISINEEQDECSNETDTIVSKPKKKNVNKNLVFTSTISDHDIEMRINQIKRWLTKGHETLVRVSSSVPNQNRLESIFQKFVTVFTNFEETGTLIQQKRITDRDLKFNIVLKDLERFKKKFFNNTVVNNDHDHNDQTGKTMNPKKLLENE